MTFVKSEIKPLKKGADMGSLLRRVKERKKTRRLGEVEVMEQEGYGELEVDSKVEMIRATGASRPDACSRVAGRRGQ